MAAVAEMGIPIPSGNLTWPLDKEKLRYISYVDLSTAFLSILGAGSIVVYAIHRRNACSKEVSPLFQLSLADMIASLLLVAETVIFNVVEYHQYPDEDFCRIISGLVGSLFISTFLLTFMYAAEIYIRVHNRLANNDSKTRVQTLFCKAMYAFSWLAPFLLMATILVAVWMEHGWFTPERHGQASQATPTSVLPTPHAAPDNATSAGDALSSEQIGNLVSVITFDGCAACVPLFHYKNDVCYSAEEDRWTNLFKWAFILPLVLVMISNTVIYVLVWRMVRQLQRTGGIIGTRQYAQAQQVRQKTLQYQLVFFFCWLPCLFLGLLSFSHHFSMQNNFWLYIVQAATAPLQGLLNSVVYGWNRIGFRTAAGKRDRGQSLLSSHVNNYDALSSSSF